MRDWVTRGLSDAHERRDFLRILCGGPGYGKSSFSRIFAETANVESLIRTVYIPLHRLEFDPEKDLRTEITTYLYEEGFNFGDPLDPNCSDNVFLILDGLDELAMQSEEASQVAIKFVEQVVETLARLNRDRRRVFCLISGRDTIVQSLDPKFDLEEITRHLVPLAIEREESELYRWQPDTITPQDRDQRDLWWQKYGAAINKPYTEMPSELRGEDLNDITRLPILIHLLALSYDSPISEYRLDFSRALTLHQIYNDLLQRIHERVWARNRTRDYHRRFQNPHLKEMDFLLFERLLCEIAMAAWYSGDTRSARVEEIEQRCEQAGFKDEWDKYKSRSQDALTRVFTSFYIRWTRFGSGTVEFTHKSFGDYLVSRYIVRVCWENMFNASQKGENKNEILSSWLQTCGPVTLDPYILGFITSEVAAEGIVPMSEHSNQRVSVLPRWQKTVEELIRFVLENGMPIGNIESTEKLTSDTNLSIKSLLRLSANAEVALFCLLNACVNATQNIGLVECPGSLNLSNWIKRIIAALSDDDTETDCFRILPILAYCKPTPDHLNLSQADLFRANLSQADLFRANLSRADLSQADLFKAKLIETDLTEANLRGANLRGANLMEARLTEAKLKEADLTNIRLIMADLRGAELRGAILVDANLRGAILIEADLREANLLRANLTGAKLRGAKLRGAKMKKTQLIGADLTGADLTEADLIGADLTGATIIDTDFTRALYNVNTKWMNNRPPSSAINHEEQLRMIRSSILYGSGDQSAEQ